MLAYRAFVTLSWLPLVHKRPAKQRTSVAGSKRCGTSTAGNTGRGILAEQREPRKAKSVEGRVTKVDAEKNLFWVKPRKEDITRFRYEPEELEVTLEGAGAGPKDIEKGQRAEVTFLEKDDDKDDKRGASRAVKLSLRGWR